MLAGGALVACVAATLFFLDLGRYPLWDVDEARHAEVAREMAAARGARRLFLPTLEFEPYREKPAPFYWLVSLAYALGGVGAGTARAVSATAGLLTVLATYAWAVGRVGVPGAVGAALVLATSAGWTGLARYVNLDMTLTACIAAGVLAGLAWLDRAPPRRPPLVPYVAAGLGTLIKGPLAAVLVAGPLLLAIAARRPRPAWRELGLVRGVAVAAVLVALLWIPVAVLEPAYVRHFLGTNLRRFGGEAPHAEPFWYYVAWIPALCLPWTLLAPMALVRAARDPERRVLVLWAAFVPALLTLASGKLATYALSALVPLALVIGPDLARVARQGAEPAEDRWLRVGGAAGGVLLAAAPAALLLVRRYPVSPLGCVLLAGAALAWAGGLAWCLRGGRTRLLPLATLGAVVTLYPLATRFVAPAVSVLHSHRDAAALVTAAAPGAPVVAFAARAPSLVFYLRGPVLRTEDLRLVADLFARDEPIFLVAGHRHFERLERALGARAHRWLENPRRRLYGNRPPPDAVAPAR